MTALIFMVVFSFSAFFFVFFYFRDRSYQEMTSEAENRGFNKKDIILSSRSEMIAGDKKSGAILYSKASRGVKGYIFPAKKISRWYEHEKKEEKVTYHCITIVFDIEDIDEVTFDVVERKTIANAISYFNLLKNKSENVDSEVKRWEIPVDQCTSNQRGMIFGSISALLVVAIFYYFGAFSPEPTNEEVAAERQQRNESECRNEMTAIGHSRQFVRRATTGSVSFVRSENETRKIGECEFMVFSAFEGENVFGGTVTNYYTVRMKGRVEDGQVVWYGSTPLIDSSRSAVQQLFREAN